MSERPTRRHPEIDERIEDNLTLVQLGNIAGMSKQAAEQYLWRTNQHEDWKFYRKKDKRDEREKSKIIGGLLGGVIKSKLATSIEQRAWEKVELYQRNTKWMRRDPMLVFDIARRKLEAEATGEKVSLSQLARGLTKYSSDVSDILRRMNMSTTDKPWIRKPITDEIRFRVYGSVDSELSTEDMGDFLETGGFNVRGIMNKISPERRTQPIINMGPPNGVLKYRDASKIYAGLDSGMSKKEIKEKMKLSDKLFNYAIDERDTFIEDDLIEGLQMMFPERDIDRPYLVNEE